MDCGNAERAWKMPTASPAKPSENSYHDLPSGFRIERALDIRSFLLGKP
jgi:hypothetical protein